MTPYVLGYAFYNKEDGLYVALIEKTRPDWQKGKLNGIGGKIELNENPLDAMRREFEEETSVRNMGWKLFCQFHDDKDFYIYCYMSFPDVEPKTMTDEKVGLYMVNKLPNNIIPNLRWLIPMSLSFNYGEPAEQFVVKKCIKS